MMIRQFTGATIDEILPQVRDELGDDALIISTRRVAKGGIGGFFGRELIEVTAAPGGQGGIAEANADAAARPGEEHEGGRSPFSRHLQGSLQAAREAEEALRLLDSFDLPIGPAAGGAPAAAPTSAYARGAAAPAPRPFAPGDVERTQAIIEAARDAMRQAHAQSTATAAPEAPAGPRVQPPPWATVPPLSRATPADR
ncbi:MAG: hypothetical protein AB1416_09980, partial [Actinomycetota bacterium]